MINRETGIIFSRPIFFFTTFLSSPMYAIMSVLISNPARNLHSYEPFPDSFQGSELVKESPYGLLLIRFAARRTNILQV